MSQSSKQFLSDESKALIAQNHQKKVVDGLLSQMDSDLSNISAKRDKQMAELETLLATSGSSLDNKNIKHGEAELASVDTSDIDSLLELCKQEDRSRLAYVQVEQIDVFDNANWAEYLDKIDRYAEQNSLDLTIDPFTELLSQRDREEIAKRIRDDYTMKKAKCDKWDYLIASFSGVATGLIDVFFVGAPGDSALGTWTDKQADTIVAKFTAFVYKTDQKKKFVDDPYYKSLKLPKECPDSIAGSIGYLEKRFKVNYDARYAADLDIPSGSLSMSPQDHHLKSLGHAPDIIGLFFSILDQFTGKTSIISDGKYLHASPSKNSNFRLQGNSLIGKLFCGVANWLGHILSDLSGSSGTRGHNDGRRGSGVAIPFYEMFQLCDFGSINIGSEQKTFAEFSTRLFQEGYDARHGAAMAIPVVLNDLIIRLLWGIKAHYYHKKEWVECMPFGDKPELRRMLVVGHGCLCLVDGLDALIRSGGNALLFGLRINIVAWSKFAFIGFQEIRVLYRSDALNIDEMEKDLEFEWQELYDAGC